MRADHPCPTCGRPVSDGPCAVCLLGGSGVHDDLGARPLWEDLGEAGDIFEVIDGFAVVRRLGEGGMGEVFLARQLSTGRQVALKLLRTAVSAARFRKEIAALAVLGHPGIVPILHAGEHGGRPYFAMEFVDGVDLGVRIRTEPLTVRESMEAMVAVARAMAHAHGQGILHRDLKPQNILLGRDGLPRVTDFGLARFVGESDSEALTVSSTRLGTPAYMAPEQVAGDRAREGTWTDVYGLGATLYALLTGVAPFRGDSVEGIFRQVLEQDVVSPRTLRPELDQDVETLVLASMEKDPASRYATAGEWADEAERWLRGEPLVRRPAGPVSRAVKWCRRKPVVASLGISLLIVTAMGLGAVLWQWRQTEAANRELVKSMSAQHLQAIHSLTRQDPSLGEPLRMMSRHLRAIPGDRASATRLVDWLSSHPFPVPVGEAEKSSGTLATVRWSPDGRGIVLASQAGTNQAMAIRFWDLVEGRWRGQEQVVGFFPGGVGFSEDGAWLATGFADGLRIWRPPALEPVATLIPGGATPLEFAWHPVVSDLVSWREGGRLVRMGADGSLRWEQTVGSGIGCVAFSGDGSRVAVGLTNGWVELRDAVTGAIQERLDFGGHPVLSVALDGRGAHVGVLTSVSGEQREATLRRVSDGRITGPFPAMNAVVFSPDGRWLLAVGPPPVLVDVEAGRRAALPPGEDVVSENGWMGSAAGLVSVIDGRTILKRGDPVAPLRGEPLWHPWIVEDVVPSPDGTRIAVVDSERTASTWLMDPPVQRPIRIPAGRTVAARPGDSILATGGVDGVVQWTAENGLGAAVGSAQLRGAVRVLRYSSWGRWLVAGTVEGDVRLWDGESRGSGQTLEWAGGLVRSVSFSSDEAVVAVLGGNSDLRFFATSDGRALGPTIAVEKGRESEFGNGSWVVRFQPGTRRAAVGSFSRMVTVWDSVGSNLVQQFAHPVGAVAHLVYGPQGDCLATASFDGAIRIWDVRTGQLRVPAMRQGDDATALDLSPDGRLLVSGGKGEIVRLWDFPSGRGLGEMRIPNLQANAFFRELGFSPDGRWLAAASSDGRGYIFDVESRLLVLPPIEPGSAGAAVSWSPDGRVCAVAAEGGGVVVRRLPQVDRTVPAWLPRLADAVAGNLPDTTALREWKACQSEALGPGSWGFYRSWAEWFFVGRFEGRNPVW